jgi:hypothetical protein
MTEASVRIRHENGQERMFDRKAIAEVRFRAPRSRSSAFGRGFVCGSMIVGGAVVLGLLSSPCEPGAWVCLNNPASAVLAGAYAGSVAGVLVGTLHAAVPGSHWKRLDRVSAVIAPQKGGVRGGITLRF